MAFFQVTNEFFVFTVITKVWFGKCDMSHGDWWEWFFIRWLELTRKHGILYVQVDFNTGVMLLCRSERNVMVSTQQLRCKNELKLFLTSLVVWLHLSFLCHRVHYNGESCQLPLACLPQCSWACLMTVLWQANRWTEPLHVARKIAAQLQFVHHLAVLLTDTLRLLGS